MRTVSDQVLAIAESQIGVREMPMGSNRGGSEKYQEIYGSFYVGLAWCGCFVGWVWSRVSTDWKALAHPATATMCDIARDQGLECEPTPGAAFVDCGTHTGLLHSDLGNGMWRTIDGNWGDQVAWATRDISGMTIYAPQGIGEAQTPTTWFFLQDVELAEKRMQHAYAGGFASAAERNARMAELEGQLGHELRPFRDNRFERPFFIDNSHAIHEVYGGWVDQDARDRSRITLDERLGRRLRPFSEVRDPGIRGVPWGLENLA